MCGYSQSLLYHVIFIHDKGNSQISANICFTFHHTTLHGWEIIKFLRWLPDMLWMHFHETYFHFKLNLFMKYNSTGFGEKTG